MGDMRKLVRDIGRGADREKNLPLYGGALARAYLNFAAVELTFSAFLLYDSMQEISTMGSGYQNLYKEALSLLACVSEDTGEQSLEFMERIGNLRDRITAGMDVFTSYVDRLSSYDQVLSRMQFRFEPDADILDSLNDLEEDAFIEQVLQFVTSDSDRMVVMERLRVLVELIPVRMTKNKLLDRISEAVSLYEGSDREALDGFVYRIRSAATLHRPEDDTAFGAPVKAYLERLENTDFTQLDKKTFEELQEEMLAVTDIVREVTDFYCMVQKVVNTSYALYLVRGHVDQKSGDYLACMEILKEVVQETCQEQSLVKLEGKIEEYVERTTLLEAVLPEVRLSNQELLREMGLYEDFEHYAVISKLLSDSLFVNIHSQSDNCVVDEAALRKVKGELDTQFSQFLGSLPKMLRRSVTSAVLRELPLDFANTNEIREYIRTNLFGCQDFSERNKALIEIREFIMQG